MSTTATEGRRVWGNPTVGLVLRVGLAIVLGWAGIVKLLEPDGAREAIMAYRIPGMSLSVATALGWGLPVLEIVLAVLLLVGLFTRIAAVVTALLMTAFIAGIVGAWVRGYSIDCGCFGGGGDVSESGRTLRYASEVMRDLLFVGAACWLAAWPRTRWSLDGSPSQRHDWDDDFADLDEVDDTDPAATSPEPSP